MLLLVWDWFYGFVTRHSFDSFTGVRTWLNFVAKYFFNKNVLYSKEENHVIFEEKYSINVAYDFTQLAE